MSVPARNPNSPAADHADLSGTTLDRYNLEAFLGAGSMGRVYRAVHTVTLRPCALKLLPDELVKHPGFISHFRAEAQMLAKLNHPNVVQIYTGCEAQSRFFLEMEYIDGGDLQKHVTEAGTANGKGLPEAEVEKIARSVVSALDYAHRHGIIHRDLKPANILLSKTGDVKVSDFGLAAVIGEEHHRNIVQATVSSFTLAKVTSMETIPSQSASGSGSFAGTILYMSPQAMRADPPDPRDDLFSLGIVVYYMLTGRTPSINYTPVSRQRRQLKYNWDPFIATCLAEERGDRFASAAAAEKALMRLRKRRTKWFLAATATAAVALSALGGAFAIHHFQRPLEHPVTPPVGIVTPPPKDQIEEVLAQQTIRFEPVAKQITTMVPVPLVAKASSGLPVQFVVVKGSAIIADSKLTAREAGEIKVRALQNGDAHYAPASPVEYTVQAIAGPTVPPASATDQRKAQTIVIDGIPEKIFPHTAFDINAHSNSGLPISLSVTSGPAKINGRQLSISGAGRVILHAEQSGNTAFLPARAVDKEFLVNDAVAESDSKGKALEPRKNGPLVPRDEGPPGPSGDENHQQARQVFEKAAAGNADAMYKLGTLYDNGQGGPEDNQIAQRWYEKAAGAGSADAMFKLGALYDNGLNAPRDDAKARQWYEKAAAAGSAKAMSRLGVLYYSGKGIARDYERARRWFEKGANGGNAEAMSNLGVFYENGIGVPRDYGQARQWYEKGAVAGSAEAMSNLGTLYQNGVGVNKDSEQALQWYGKAAAAGNVGAMYDLGLLYERGLGVKQNWTLALQWYNKAVAAGSASAMRHMGALYQNGTGVTQDYEQALQWYGKAAAAGSVEAMYYLGYLYSGGQGVKGVKLDRQKSREYYEKAAAAGNTKAMVALGSIYEDGAGVPKDNQQARKWYEKAAAGGEVDAKNRLRSMGK